MIKLREYLVRCCLVSNKLSCISDLVNGKVISINKKIKKMCIGFGFECDCRGNLVQAPFTKTLEWKWFMKIENDHNKIDIFEYVEICMNNHLDKTQLSFLFQKKTPDQIWSYFLQMTKDQLSFITCKLMSTFLTHKYTGNKPSSIIYKMFTLHKTTKKLESVVSTCISEHKLTAEQGVENLIKIFNENKCDDYSHLQHLCSLFISEDGSFRKKYILNVNELYWLYKLLSPKLHSNLRKAIFQTNTSLKYEKDCPICLSEFEKGNTNIIYNLPCGHCFHKECVMQDVSRRYNLTGTYKCPLCRTNIHLGSLNIFQPVM
tara:strand:- start:21 stop:971 length:951 start_codon:yes stop_codon:yes gene_type:complete